MSHPRRRSSLAQSPAELARTASPRLALPPRRVGAHWVAASRRIRSAQTASVEIRVRRFVVAGSCFEIFHYAFRPSILTKRNFRLRRYFLDERCPNCVEPLFDTNKSVLEQSDRWKFVGIDRHGKAGVVSLFLRAKTEGSSAPSGTRLLLGLGRDFPPHISPPAGSLSLGFRPLSVFYCAWARSSDFSLAPCTSPPGPAVIPTPHPPYAQTRTPQPLPNRAGCLASPTPSVRGNPIPQKVPSSRSKVPQ
jgi:hypothetical protein